MAVQDYLPDSMAATARRRPIDSHGKLRFLYAMFNTPVGVVGDIGSLFEVGRLPPGAVRVLPSRSSAGWSAMGAARTLQIGHKAYRSKQDAVTTNDGIEPQNLGAFASAVDVSAAGVGGAAFTPTDIKYDVFSQSGVDVAGQINGGTIPASATLEVLLAYLYE